MLRQIERGVQNEAIAKNEVLPVTTLFFLKIFLQFKNLLYRVNLMFQLPRRPYHTFRKRWTFNRGYFFTVSILKH